MKTTVLSQDAIVVYYKSKDEITRKTYNDSSVFDADRAHFFKKNRNGHVYTKWYQARTIIHHRLRKGAHSGVERRLTISDWPKEIKMLRLLED